MVVESGYTQARADEVMIATQKKTLEEMKLRDMKAKNYLFQSLDKIIFEDDNTEGDIKATLGLNEDEVSKKHSGLESANQSSSQRV